MSVPFQRVRTWLTILDATDPLPPDLGDALTRLTSIEGGNRPGMFVPTAPGTFAFVWRGYLTGGIATVYEHLSRLLDRHGFAALIGDDRLEIHVYGGSDEAIILTPTADPLKVDRTLLEDRLEAVVDLDDLARWFLPEGPAAAEVGDAAVRPRSSSAIQAPPGAQVEVPPGVIDLGLVADATFHLVESYTSNGLLDDAIVECRSVGGHWRTDVHAPCVDSAPGEGPRGTWRLAQWRRLDGPDHGRWVLEAREDIDLVTVVRCLPADLRSWAAHRTEAAIVVLDRLADALAVHGAAADRDRLRYELTCLTTR